MNAVVRKRENPKVITSGRLDRVSKDFVYHRTNPDNGTFYYYTESGWYYLSVYRSQIVETGRVAKPENLTVEKFSDDLELVLSN